jgi:hypothetical protein
VVTSACLVDSTDLRWALSKGGPPQSVMFVGIYTAISLSRDGKRKPGDVEAQTAAANPIPKPVSTPVSAIPIGSANMRTPDLVLTDSPDLSEGIKTPRQLEPAHIRDALRSPWAHQEVYDTLRTHLSEHCLSVSEMPGFPTYPYDRATLAGL